MSTINVSILAKPKKIKSEIWLENITEAIADNYCLSEEALMSVKKALFDTATAEGDVSYTKFINNLRNQNVEGMIDGNIVANTICPMYLKKNEWTAEFDVKDAPGLDTISVKTLRRLIKLSCDKNFTNFVLRLWAYVNVPELWNLI